MLLCTYLICMEDQTKKQPAKSEASRITLPETNIAPENRPPQ